MECDFLKFNLQAGNRQATSMYVESDGNEIYLDRSVKTSFRSFFGFCGCTKMHKTTFKKMFDSRGSWWRFLAELNN
jgi:hypothetical protein